MLDTIAAPTDGSLPVMNSPSRPPLVAWFILAFATIQVRGLWVDWQHSPMDRLGWLALALWLIPGIFHRVARGGNPVDRLSTLFLLSAAALLLVGVASELHAMAHVAFALAVAAIARPRSLPWLWLIGAISWMPILTSMTKELPLAAIISLRIIIASVACIIGFLPLRKSPASS